MDFQNDCQEEELCGILINAVDHDTVNHQHCWYHQCYVDNAVNLEFHCDCGHTRLHRVHGISVNATLL